jgi:hypothetical protein
MISKRITYRGENGSGAGLWCRQYTIAIFGLVALRADQPEVVRF